MVCAFFTPPRCPCSYFTGQWPSPSFSYIFLDLTRNSLRLSKVLLFLTRTTVTLPYTGGSLRGNPCYLLHCARGSWFISSSTSLCHLAFKTRYVLRTKRVLFPVVFRQKALNLFLINVGCCMSKNKKPCNP